MELPEISSWLASELEGLNTVKGVGKSVSKDY